MSDARAAAARLSMSDREAAIRQYAPLVKYVVGRLAIGLPSILDYEDILSYGTIGLIEALDRYDGSKGVKFETYAIARIRGAIIDALRSLDRLPRSVRQKAKRLDQATSQLMLELGREPTDEEVAQALGITLEQYQQMLIDTSWVTVSLDGLLDRDEQSDTGMTDLPADPNQEDFTLAIERRQLLEALARAIRSLPEREALILSLYYKDEMTMREIAEILEISESRVCQLHARALSRLRAWLAREQEG
ncbi:RNA polymerase sigma factor FliA [bacterium HR29]|jgi:RNA polymerase sigma factor for flagellar operon FliA|nr:RNA polymerase sigma factor FliA [bacterium HR29]